LKHTQNILGIFGILILVFGILSLVFPYSATVNNNAYAQTTAGGGSGGGVDLGPLVIIGPPNRSTALDTVSDGTTTYVSYQAQGENNVYLALVNSGPGGRGEQLRAPPENIIPGGSDPAIAVGGDKIFVTATRNGQNDIAITECTDNEDNCEDPQSVSTEAPQIETSCFDDVDGDGDGVADELDPDCAPCFPDVEPTTGVNSATLQFVTNGGPVCPFEEGPECVDDIDNDGDSVIDEEDPDCSIEGGNSFALNCDDGIDNDNDELTDSEDPGCNESGEELCSNDIDDDGDGFTDGADPGCTVEPPPVVIEGEGGINSCNDGLDNDGDEQTDFYDEDCQSDSGGLCSDGEDNDDDGLTDFDDPDCGSPPDLAASPQGDSDNNATEVEPTSFNQQTIPTTPQLTFVQSGGGGAPPASNSDVAASSDGDDVYVVWQQDGDIMFRAGHGCADANGCEYGDILDLSNNNAGTSKEPRVATSSDGQFVHVAWQDNTPGNDEIFYSRSTNAGGTFNGGNPVGNPTNLSNTPRASNDHQLVAEGTNVYVVWVDFTTGNGDIYFKRSNNNGASFNTSPTNLSRGSGLSFLSSRDPDMAAQGSLVGVIWTVYPTRTATGPGEIIFRESTNNGNSFGSHIVISKTPLADSKEPQVDYTPEDSERYFAWNDKGGPRRVYTAAGTFNVLAAESDNGRTISATVNLSDAPNEPDRRKQTSQLQVVDDVAIWDPRGRRG
jgi:hypothetical protein